MHSQATSVPPSLNAKSLELQRYRDSLSAAETTTTHTGSEELLKVAARVMTKILLREKGDTATLLNGMALLTILYSSADA